MGRISFLSYILLFIGVILVILAGFNDGNVPPVGFWGSYGQYILLIGGVMLVVLAIALMIRDRK